MYPLRSIGKQQNFWVLFEMFMKNVFAFWRNWPWIFGVLLSNLNCSVNSFIYLHYSIYKQCKPHILHQQSAIQNENEKEKELLDKKWMSARIYQINFITYCYQTLLVSVELLYPRLNFTILGSAPWLVKQSQLLVKQSHTVTEAVTHFQWGSHTLSLKQSHRQEKKISDVF